MVLNEAGMEERTNLWFILLLAVASIAKAQESHSNGPLGLPAALSMIAAIRKFTKEYRLTFESAQGLSYGKVAVLITRRHLVTIANAIDVPQTDRALRYLLLGECDTSNDQMMPDCDANANCCPSPKLYEIKETVVHPEYNTTTLSHNVAIVLLKQPVTYSQYIKPICMPPANFMVNSTIGQHLYIAGFAYDKIVKYKFKKLIQVEGRQHCRDLGGIYKNEHNYCGYSDSAVELVGGSPIIRIHAEDNEPQNVFLVGLLHAGRLNLVIFQPIELYHNWIEWNMQFV